MGGDEAKDAGGGREEFLTARQLAEFLQVSESTVRKLSREGRIPVVRLTPRLPRYHLTAVLKALDGDGARSRSSRRVPRPETGDDQQLSFDDLM